MINKINLENANFIVASGPVIIEDNKVLLNRHGHGDDDEKEKEYWKFVGGRIEEIDNKNQFNILENACKREVMEEMGVKVKNLRAIKPIMIVHPDKPKTIVILIHYLAERVGEIKAGKDIEEWKWFDIDKLPDNCAPNIKQVIEEYKRMKK